MMRFLGTSAGEGIPNPFCTCRVCENARRVKGREMRMRSSFMLDENTFIDLGADYVAQAFAFDLNLDKAKHVLYTHMHDDHMNYTIFWERLVKHEGCGEPLNVYLSEEAYSFVTDFLMTSNITDKAYIHAENVLFHQLKFLNSYSIGDYRITPLRGSHSTAFEKNASNYLIEKDGKKLYYAVDSGYFPEETFLALKNEKLDIFIGECTFPVRNKAVVKENSGHMDLRMCLKNLERLYNNGTITEHTAIYLTHISGKDMTHAELEEYVRNLGLPYKIQIAYDGLCI